MTTHSPKVSVIVPNYNHAKYLELRLRSIFEQTYQDFEVILLDDASTDNSREILKRYASNSSVHIHFNEINSGSPFKQWNKGVALAKGEYIWLAESDDYADPKFLEVLVALLDSQPTVGLSYSQSWRIDAESKVLGCTLGYTEHISATRWMSNYINYGRDECIQYLSKINTIPNASAVLFRRSVFLNAGGADGSYRLCGDWITWIRLLLRSDIAHVAENLNYYRFHNATVRAVSDRQGTTLYETLRIMKELRQLFPDQLENIQANIKHCKGIYTEMCLRRIYRPSIVSLLQSHLIIREFDRFIEFHLFNEVLARLINKLA